MPRQVAVAINDLVDSCGEIKPGQQVLIVAASDGLTGGVNIVDEATIAWIQAAVQQRGAYASVLWTDIPSRIHAWRVPPVIKAAVAGIDVMISHAFDLPFEELYELRDVMTEHRAVFVRNMATTALLVATSAWTRCESRGAHYRLDYPTERPALAHRTMTTLTAAREIAAALSERAPAPVAEHAA